MSSNVQFFLKQLSPTALDDINVVDCPRCGTQKDCLKMTENKQDSYLCLYCGYQTTYTLKSESEVAYKMLDSMPKLIQDLAEVSEKTNTYWTPSIVHIPTIGMLYPEGTLESWHWSVSPYIQNENEKSVNEYSHRLAVEQTKEFDQKEFINAIEYLKQLVMLGESSSTTQ